jgi:4-amino-4-deoxy-L-arabinose transferase-like glycosyltransferase
MKNKLEMTVKGYSVKKLLSIIFIIALIIRVVYGLVMFNYQGTSIWDDAWDYIGFAENILSQGIFVPDVSRISALSGPGFPAILAIMFLIFGKTYIPIIILNALVSSFLCILIYFLGKEIFNHTVGILASVWSIFYVLFIRYIPQVLKENWVSFLFVLIILLLFKNFKRDKINLRLFLFSLLFTFFIHLDERFLVYFFIFPLGLTFLDSFSWKLGLKKAVIFVVLVILFMVPWLIRNYHVYGRVVILTERTAWITDKYFGYKTEAHKLRRKRSEDLERYDRITKSLLAGEDVDHDIKYMDTLKKAIKLGYIPHRYNKMERWWAEFKEFWRSFRFKGGFVGHGYRFEGPSWSLKHNLSLILTYGILLPFFLIGIFFVVKGKEKYGMFVLCIIIMHTIIHVFMAHVRNRYRIPIDAFIIILAFYGLQQLFWKFKSWREGVNSTE